MNFIKPNWPAPSHINALTTTRQGGFSRPPYDSFNLAEHVGETPETVTANRQALAKILDLPNEPIWLEQTHSAIVLPALDVNRGKEADAAFTSTPNQVCVIMTADCLPILLCNQTGTQIAAIHAGWRGIARGVIENTLAALQNQSNSEILAWLGPAIGQRAYEVGEEVRQEFLSIHPEATGAFFPSPNGRWLASLTQLATLCLQKVGVSQIFGGNHCTYSEKELFYSYRRDGAATGRMASLIWFS